MSTQIDSLSIKIESNSSNAKVAIDGLIDALERLKKAGNLNSITKNLKKISDAANKGLSKLPSTFSKASKSAKEYSNSVKDAEHHTHKFSTSISKVTSGIGSFIGSALGIYGVGQMFQSAASAAMEWEGISARFGEGFGEQADEAYKHVMKLQDALFINDQMFMQYSSNFATLGRGMGVPARAIADVSTGLTELAYDIYAKNNDFYSIEEALDAVRSAYLGEIEPIRKAGISITEATLKEAAANYGLTQSVETMTEAQKMQLRYKVMVDQAYASSTVGTYIKELNTVEGSARALVQQLKGLAQTIGAVLLPVVAAVMPYIQAFVSLLTMAIQAIGAFFGIEVKAPTWSSGMDSLGESAGAATESVNGATDALGSAAAAAKKLKDYTMGFDELNVIKPQDNTGSGGGSSGGGGAGGDLGLDLDSLWTDSMIESANAKAKAIAKDMQEFLEPIIDWIKTHLNDIATVVAAIGTGLLAWNVSTTFAGLLESLKTGGALAQWFEKNKVSLGITVLVSGLTLSFLSAYDIGYNGVNWKNVIMTAIGNALAIGGSLLTFGTGPLGWTVGIGMSLVLNVLGITIGANKRKLQDDLEKRFGEYVLSKDELEAMASKLTTIGLSPQVDLYISENEIVDDLQKTVNVSIEKLQSLNFKAMLGLNIDEDSYKTAVDDFITSAMDYLQQKQVVAALAVDIAFSSTETGTRLTEFTNTFYSQSSGKLSSLGEQLKAVVAEGFSNGEWIPDKLAEAVELQKEIQEVLDYISDVEFKAKIEALKLDASQTSLTSDSFKDLLDKTQETIEEQMVNLEEIRLEGIKIAKMEFDQNILNGMAEEEAQKIYDTTVEEADRVFRKGKLELNFGTFDFGIDAIKNAYSKEIKAAAPLLKKETETLFVNGTMAVLPEQAYDNVEVLMMQLRDSYVNGFAQIDITPQARQNIGELIEALKPTTTQYAEVAAEARKMGEKVPENVAKGLNDANLLGAIAGNADAINYMVGKHLSTDASFLDTLSTAENAGKTIGEYTAAGLLNNLTIVENAADGTVTLINDTIGEKTLEVTPALVKNFKDMGFSLSDGLIAGAESGVQESKTSWLDWALWPWNWFKKENDIHSPSGLFEKGGKYLVDGLVKGLNTIDGAIKNVWSSIPTWFSGISTKVSNSFTTLTQGIKTGFTNAKTNVTNTWGTVSTWFGNVWSSIKTTFSPVGTWFKSNFTTAWNNVKNAWSSAKTWFSSIWTGIKNTFSSVGTWFKSTFTSAWTNIKNVFSGWSSFFSGLWNKIKNTFSGLGTSLGNAIGGSVKTAINRVISWIETTINKAIGLINGAIRTINKLPGVNVSSLKTISIPRLATGGFVGEGQLFIARERGPEMVGTMNGGTAVANNEQIVEGISQGVYAAVVAAMSQSSGGDKPMNVNVFLDSKQITASVEKRQRESGVRIMTGGVTYGY